MVMLVCTLYGDVSDNCIHCMVISVCVHKNKLFKQTIDTFMDCFNCNETVVEIILKLVGDFQIL